MKKIDFWMTNLETKADLSHSTKYIFWVHFAVHLSYCRYYYLDFEYILAIVVLLFVLELFAIVRLTLSLIFKIQQQKLDKILISCIINENHFTFKKALHRPSFDNWFILPSVLWFVCILFRCPTDLQIFESTSFECIILSTDIIKISNINLVNCSCHFCGHIHHFIFCIKGKRTLCKWWWKKKCFLCHHFYFWYHQLHSA